MNNKNTPKLKRVSFTIPIQLWNKLEVKQNETGYNISDLMRRAIEALLEK